MDSVRIAAIADIHHGRDDETKLGSKALSLLDEVLGEIVATEPDLLVDLGDRITDAGVDEDKQLTRDVAKRFRDTGLQRAHLQGNHDVEFLEESFLGDVLDAPVSHQRIQIRGWNLIFWQADPHYRRGNLRIPDEDLRWLSEELRSCAYPTVIFTHVPLDRGAMDGNYYFETAPDGRAFHRNAEAARDLITESESVVLVVSGHTHWNRLNTVDGVHFITVQSLTETFTTFPEPAGAWAEIRLGDVVCVEVHGRDPVRLDLPLRGQGVHWPRRTPPETGRRPPTFGGNRAEPKGIILDLDGVVYSGSILLPGANEFLTEMRDTGVPVVAVTNHTGYRSPDVALRLAKLGVDFSADDIITAGWAAAQHIAEIAPKAKVYVVGDPALSADLSDAGLSLLQAQEALDSCDYVVAGYCSEFSRSTLERAVSCLLAGATLIGTNPDRLLPTPSGPIPEAGPTIAFLERASGQNARIIGKPNTHIIDCALAKLGVGPQEALIVGDNMETDIAAGANSGIRTVLIEQERAAVGSAGGGSAKDHEPDFRVRDLSELCALLQPESKPVRGG